MIKDSKAVAEKVQRASGADSNSTTGVDSSTTVLEAIRSNTVNLKLRFMPQSLAAQTQYFFENHERAKKLNKVVIVNLGYGGLSVSGSEFTEKEMKVYTDKYSTDCAGRAIDEAIMEDFKKEIKEANDSIDVDNLTDKQISEILKELIKAKEKLTAGGADEVTVDLQLGEDYIDFTYSVAKLNECLTKAGIVDHFDAFVRGYISEHKYDLKDGFDIAIIGGSLRIPLLQTKLQNILKEYDLKGNFIQSLHMDDSPSHGASCLAVNSSYNVSASEKVRQLPGLDKGAISRFEVLIENNKILTELAADRNAIEGKKFELERLVNDLISRNKNLQELDSAITSFCDEVNELCGNEVGKIQNLINYGYTSEVERHRKLNNDEFEYLVKYMQGREIDQKLKDKVISTIQNLQSSVKEKFSNMKPQPVEDFGTDTKQTDAETEYMRKMKAFDDAFNNTRQRVKEMPAPQKLQIFVQKEDAAEKVIVDSSLAYTMQRQAPVQQQQPQMQRQPQMQQQPQIQQQPQVQQQPQIQQQAQVQQQKATGDKTLIDLLRYQERLFGDLSNNQNTFASTEKINYLYPKYIQYSMSVLYQAIYAKEGSDYERGKVIALCGQSLSKCGEILSTAEITGDYAKDLKTINLAFSDQNELKTVTDKYIYNNCFKAFSKINNTLLNQDQKQTLEAHSMALRAHGKVLEILGNALSSGEYGVGIASATTSGVKTSKSKSKFIAPKQHRKPT